MNTFYTLPIDFNVLDSSQDNYTFRMSELSISNILNSIIYLYDSTKLSNTSAQLNTNPNTNIQSNIESYNFIKSIGHSDNSVIYQKIPNKINTDKISIQQYNVHT